MPKKISHEDYLDKLNSKGIHILPLEKYVGAQKKILHKCSCGNEWQITPHGILNGQKCMKCRNTSRNISNEDYFEQITKKKIKVTPLETYVDSKTKILHKCLCGKEWKITPNSVLSGATCGCTSKTRLKTDDEYKEELLSKNINVIPLEKYKGIKTKILHKCSCGNIWNVEPDSVLKDIKCGCRNVFHNEKYYKNKKTLLYSLKLNNILYKIGITLYRENPEKSIKTRFSNELGQGMKIKILDWIVGNDGAEIYKLEQKILKDSKNLSVNESQKILKGGNTELRTKEIKLNKYK